MLRSGSSLSLFFDVFAAVTRLSNHSCILRRVTEHTQKEGGDGLARLQSRVREHVSDGKNGVRGRRARGKGEWE